MVVKIGIVKCLRRIKLFFQENKNHLIYICLQLIRDLAVMQDILFLSVRAVVIGTRDSLYACVEVQVFSVGLVNI